MNLDVVFVGKRADRIPGLKATEILFLPSYTTVNLAAAYVVRESLSIFGKVTNLTDADYQEVVGYPALGRQVIGGVSGAF